MAKIPIAMTQDLNKTHVLLKWDLEDRQDTQKTF